MKLGSVSELQMVSTDWIKMQMISPRLEIIGVGVWENMGLGEEVVTEEDRGLAHKRVCRRWAGVHDVVVVAAWNSA